MSEILKNIEERQSSRGPYDPNRPISKENLKQILEAARWAPTGHNMQNYEIIIIDDKLMLEKIGNIKSPILEKFLRDNYEHLSFSEEEFKRKKTGVLSTWFPPDWINPAKFSQVARDTPPLPLSISINGSPTLLMILYDPRKKSPALKEDTYGYIGLGCLTENIWLIVQALGINMQILSFSNMASVEKEIKQLLGIPDPLKIIYTLRLGYQTRQFPYLRVRRDIEDFARHNNYQNKGI